MNTILTLDLNNKVPTANRDKMYEHLAKQDWKKVTELTTLWKKAWTNGSQTQAYEEVAIKEVGEAAKAAGVRGYDATVVVTANEPKTVRVAPLADRLHLLRSAAGSSPMANIPRFIPADPFAPLKRPLAGGGLLWAARRRQLGLGGLK